MLEKQFPVLRYRPEQHRFDSLQQAPHQVATWTTYSNLCLQLLNTKLKVTWSIAVTDSKVGAATTMAPAPRFAPEGPFNRTTSSGRRLNLSAKCLALGLVFALSIRAVMYLRYAMRAMNYPFSLDYAEGMVWQQALLIPGQKMYGDITHYPYIVFYYPPLYHLLVRALSSVGVDFLVAGRVISFGATIVTCAFLGAITIRIAREFSSATACTIGAIVASLMLLSFQAVQEWAVLMRVDMVAFAMASAGIYVTIIAGQRLIFLCGAFSLFVLAIFTKPTTLSAPLAAFMVASVLNLRSAARAIVFAFLLGGIALVTLETYSGGGFLRHLVAYNLNPFSFHHLADLFWVQRFDLVAAFTAVITIWLLWGELLQGHSLNKRPMILRGLKESAAMRAFILMTLWAILSSLMLFTAGRSGASDNYFIECLCVVSILIGLLMAVIWEGNWRVLGIQSPLVSYAVATFVPAALVASVLFQSTGENGQVYNADESAIQTRLVERIHDSAKPVLSEDMILLLRAGKAVPIEPFGFARLSEQGVWNQAPFLRMLREHSFAFVITTRESQAVSAQRFTPEMTDEIARNYPMTEIDGAFVMHLSTRN